MNCPEDRSSRVSLAGVMVDDVKILLFDEPLANLDPAAGRAAIELIDEIQEKPERQFSLLSIVLRMSCGGMWIAWC